jgi:hypothetical protein
MNRHKSLLSLGASALMYVTTLAADGRASAQDARAAGQDGRGDAAQGVEQAVSKEQSALSFALIGDTPYAPYQLAQVDQLIREINDSRAQFTVHVGDIKSGSTLCSDELLGQRFTQLQQLKNGLVYTPGDNEWTDCHRRNAGMYEPLERLTKLRSLFFPKPSSTTGRKPFRVYPESSVAAYAPFVENTFFLRSNVVFATLHVVGSNNGLALWDGIGETAAAPRQDRIDEVKKRTDATLAWIDFAFDQAERRGAAGVFLAMQADPSFEAAEGSDLRKGFEEVLTRISQRSIAFARPVVLAHGDSHLFRTDKPLLAPTSDANVTSAKRRLEDFTRVETFGDGEVHWVEVLVDPKTPEVFRFNARIVEANKYVR